MHSRSAVLILLLVANLGCALRTSPGQTAPSDWAAVRALPADARVRVVLRWGESIVGTVASADDDRIRIARRRATREFKRADVTRVFQHGARKTAKYRRNGALIGLAAGALAMISDGGSFGMLLAAYWTALGAGVGAAAGHATREETLIYAAVKGVP